MADLNQEIAQPVVPAPAPVVKRKPGRPPRVQPAKLAIEGVAREPKIDGNIIEVLHSSSILFKKAFAVFKSFSASDIQIKFTPTEARFVAKDHLGKSHIYVIIDGKRIERYYCQHEMTFIVTCENIHGVMSNIEKNSTNISLMVSSNDLSLLNIYITDSEYNSDYKYEVPIKIADIEEPVTYPYDDAEYPINFEFSLKGLKSLMMKLSKNGNDFTLEKSSSDPLQFVSEKRKLTAPYDDDKIKLKNKLAPHETFSVSMTIEQIKPIFVTGLSNDIQIAADPLKHMSFTAKLEQDKDLYTAIVKVFSETKSIKK
jgi:hypothetical protein